MDLVGVEGEDEGAISIAVSAMVDGDEDADAAS